LLYWEKLGKRSSSLSYKKFDVRIAFCFEKNLALALIDFWQIFGPLGTESKIFDQIKREPIIVESLCKNFAKQNDNKIFFKLELIIFF